MTPEQQTLVVRALVGPCSECLGAGKTLIIPRTKRGGWRKCPHCDGFGATLADATRENWPWWDYTGRPHHPVPFVPDFSNDPTAAVKLAEMLAKKWGGLEILPPARIDEWLIVPACYAPNVVSGESLGAALIAALEARERE